MSMHFVHTKIPVGDEPTGTLEKRRFEMKEKRKIHLRYYLS